MLVVPERKTILLNLREPDKVMALIPGAKKGPIRGKEIVAVPHTHDVVRVLRNVGIAAPGPIQHYYDWPGRFSPFIHQRETAEFCTLNPRAYVLNGMGCIAGDERVRVSRCGKSYETTLADLHRKFHKLPDKEQWKVRSLKGDQFGMNGLVDVLAKGAKPTLRITLADGKSFRCTPDHRIARPGGRWSEAIDLKIGDALITNGEVAVTCPRCGEPRMLKARPRNPGKICRQCKHRAQSERMRGEANPSWKGGKFTDTDGYVRLNMPEHHRADNHGYVYEHIVVAEAAYGGPITAEYHVHHINGVKDDNRPENLEVLLASDHHREHGHAHRAKLDGARSSKGGLVVVLPRESTVVSIEDGGVTDVYDLCMESPHHNFVVNGVVVHNSGKTVSALWAFDCLRKAGVLDWVVIICPLSTMERAWGDEIFRNFPDMSFGVVHGDAKRRMRVLQDRYDCYIVNHDGLKDKALLAALRAKEGRGLYLIDELAVFRNSGTERWKALNWLINGNKKQGLPPVEWCWGMTGTPIPNAPTDAWAQCRIVTPWTVPQYFGAFRDQVMKKVSLYKWLPRHESLDIVHRAMQPAIRFAREDCIDLPPTTYVTREVEMTAEQKRMYKDMLSRFKAEYDGGQITAMNEAVKIGKLLQIVCGVAYGVDGDMVIPAKPRIDEVLEIIDEAGAKVIVFVPLTGALQALADTVGKHYSVAVVNGETSKTQRDQIFSDFQKARDPHVLIAQPGTMAHGLSLTAASTIVWYAPVHSAEIYQQANMRIVRPGQKNNTLIVRVQGSELERRMYAKLDARENMQGTLLDLF